MLFSSSPVGKWLHTSGWSHSSIQAWNSRSVFTGAPPSHGKCLRPIPRCRGKAVWKYNASAWKSWQINRHNPGLKFSLEHHEAESTSGMGKATETKPFRICLTQIKRKSDRDKITTVPPSLDKLLDPWGEFFLLSSFLSHSIPPLPPPSLPPSFFLLFSLLPPFLGWNIPLQLFI